VIKKILVRIGSEQHDIKGNAFTDNNAEIEGVIKMSKYDEDLLTALSLIAGKDMQKAHQIELEYSREDREKPLVEVKLRSGLKVRGRYFSAGDHWMKLIGEGDEIIMVSVSSIDTISEV